MNKGPSKGLYIALLLVFGFLFLSSAVLPSMHTTNGAQQANLAPPFQFSELNDLVSSHPEQIVKITFVNGTNQVIVERVGQVTNAVLVPDEGKQDLYQNAIKHHVHVDAALPPTQESPRWPQIILGLLFQLIPFVLIIFFFIWISSRAQQNMQQQISRAQAQMIEPAHDRKTFADVAGCDEAKQELYEIVDYLRNPGLLAELGGRAPRGVLLVGPPGNGKTLLAKATAGEAGAAFFAISASQFVEMFVGVGAARVRDLFNKARAKRPAIVFIDEIDAVGRQRGAGIGGGHDEREQTLNQLLVEMDGFAGNDGLLLMAATNRPDILDPALIRPGRFDRQVLVDHADVKGREAIFRIHMRGKQIAADVSAKELARLTPGFSGAEIEGVCNEAATVAARRIRQADSESGSPVAREINREDFAEGIDRVQMGVARTSRAQSMSEQDMENTAIHELGHALVNTLLKGGDPVTKITIMPRARALGFTQSLPESDRYGYTREQLLTRIMMAMGGRAAQEALLNTVDTGAQNDFKQAWGIARRMVTEFGMSSLGPIHTSDDGDSPFLGRAMATPTSIGPELADAIDQAVQCIVENCLARAEELILQHKDFMMHACRVLLDKETLLAQEWQTLLAQHNIVPHQIDVDIECDG